MKQKKYRRRAVYEDGKPAPWLKEIAASCGVYMVHNHTGERVLYVGMSSTNRLKKTLIRHFQEWKGEGAGPVFSKDLRVTVYLTTCKDAKGMESRLIRRHQPPLNIEENYDDDPPF